MLSSLRPPLILPLRLPLHRFRCKCSAPCISSFRETFARRMAMAGIKPHHKIAIGVSGGPDSMALCVLTAGWKSDEGHGVKGGPSGYIDGLLCIVVDHGLRPESAVEARVVQGRVVKMGIRCKVESCNWPEGRPKLGHLQEAAREMSLLAGYGLLYFKADDCCNHVQVLMHRYQIFQGVCVQHQIGVLLVAHHADDQAELFILRLSRNSGVLGLAGMAFVSQLFLANTSHCNSSSNHGILLVRPMLEFSKDDMHEICRCSLQTWVEDPTNQSTLFARNRIRNALRSLFSSLFWWEVQRLVSACRLTRLFIENMCHKMLKHSVTIMDEGYSIIDLEKLDPSNINDLCLSRFLVMILQFISQRHRPIRGSVIRKLLDYFRNVPCKTSLTAAGCYLCAAPRSKGTKVIVCYSPQSPFPSKMFLSTLYYEERYLSLVIDEIIRDAKLHSDKLVVETSDMPFLHAKSSETILREAVQLKLISQSTYISICSLQMEEHENFCSKNGVEQAYNSWHQHNVSSCLNVQLYPGESCHFMCRFVIAWKVCKRIHGISSDFNESKHKSDADGVGTCQFCINSQKYHPLTIRHMVDADWLYLANLSDSHSFKDDRTETDIVIGHQEAMELRSSSYVKSSAQAALHHLKYVPAAARRGLPVLVNSQDVPVCIPSIGFRFCPCLSVVTEFRPRVPLGGGYSSYL